jgi:hypothetical protein
MKQHVYFVKEGEEGYTEITITPKDFWDTNKCVADFEEEDVTEFFEDLGFFREGDSFFVGEDMTADEMKEFLAANETFIFDEEFIKFASY